MPSSTNSKEEIRHIESHNEKDYLDTVPHMEGVIASGDDVDIDEGFDPEFVKRTMRKVDWRLIPILSLMYLVSAMDRANLSLARAANKKQMDKDLGLDLGSRYSIATLAFFIPYIILEVPSQAGLRLFGAKIWLGGATLLWGVIMLCKSLARPCAVARSSKQVPETMLIDRYGLRQDLAAALCPPCALGHV